MRYIAVIILLLASCFSLYHLSRSRKFQLFAPIVSQVQTDKPIIALTFDDGPTKAYTQDVLDLLDAKGIKATFFVTGNQTLENMDLAKSIVQAGHELGNHSFSHKRMVLKSPAFIREEIQETDKAIRQAGHVGDIYFRPPYGKKLFVLPWYLRQNNRTTIMVSVEPDTFESSAEGMRSYVQREVEAGGIILLHVMYESNGEARAALPLIISDLQNAGYSFVSLQQHLHYRFACNQNSVRACSTK